MSGLRGTIGRAARAGALGALAGGVLAASVAHAQLVTPLGFRDSLVAGSLAMPVAFAFVPDPPGTRIRAIVVEQKLRNLKLVRFAPSAATTVVGTLNDVEWVDGERGVLGAAVDPRWPAKPFVYVNYTAVGGRLHLARFTLTGDLANTGAGTLTMVPGSRMLLLADVPDSLPNHNGGSVRFGPDGRLYLSTGDDQRECFAQDTTRLAGKLLRLDVSALPDTGAGPVPRAWITPADNPRVASPDSNFRLVQAMGLRNPFRFHIDPVDGAVFVADVGHVTWEEIDRVSGFANLGWPWREGPNGWSGCAGGLPANLQDPILSLPHPEWISVIGLGVYRAPAGATAAFPPEYEGDIFFGDYFSGVVRRAGRQGSGWALEFALGQPTANDWATGAGQICDGMVGPDGAWWYLRQSLDGTYFNGVLRRVDWIGAPEDTTLSAVAAGGLAFAAPSPNPARGPVRFAFATAAAGPADLGVFDASGRLVRRLWSGALPAGSHARAWDGADDAGRPLPPGVYLARLRAGGLERVRRVALAR